MTFVHWFDPLTFDPEYSRGFCGPLGGGGLAGVLGRVLGEGLLYGEGGGALDERRLVVRARQRHVVLEPLHLRRRLTLHFALECESETTIFFFVRLLLHDAMQQMEQLLPRRVLHMVQQCSTVSIME